MTEKIDTRLPPSAGGVSAALDFIKAICHILGLDKSLEEAVNSLKSNLLRLISKFSTKSKLINLNNYTYSIC